MCTHTFDQRWRLNIDTIKCMRRFGEVGHLFTNVEAPVHSTVTSLTREHVWCMRFNICNLRSFPPWYHWLLSQRVSGAGYGATFCRCTHGWEATEQHQISCVADFLPPAFDLMSAHSHQTFFWNESRGWFSSRRLAHHSCVISENGSGEKGLTNQFLNHVSTVRSEHINHIQFPYGDE